MFNRDRVTAASSPHAYLITRHMTMSAAAEVFLDSLRFTGPGPGRYLSRGTLASYEQYIRALCTRMAGHGGLRCHLTAAWRFKNSTRNRMQ